MQPYYQQSCHGGQTANVIAAAVLMAKNGASVRVVVDSFQSARNFLRRIGEECDGKNITVVIGQNGAKFQEKG